MEFLNPEIIAIIGKLLGAAALALGTFLCKKVSEWLEAKINKETLAVVENLIDNFVKAAEQLYREDDPTGAIRNTYVKKNLEELGYVITEEINAYIESKVFDL